MRVPVFAVLAALLVTLASPAFAHARLEHASPGVGTTIHAAPTTLALTFDDDVNPARSAVTLTEVGGSIVPLGALSVSADGLTLAAAIRTHMAPGAYQVHWRAVSIDGHATSGDFAFRIG
jgi:methionine-rich copper-binding protein CopC